MSYRFAVPAALFFLVASLAACGGDARTGESVAEDDSAATDSRAAGDSAAGDTSIVPGEAASVPYDSSGPAASTDPFAGFRLEAPPGASEDTFRISLSLRNDASTDAIVYADGGAGEVLLDTIPGESSVRVDVVTRARTILLRSVSRAGDELRSTEVRAGSDTVLEVAVGRDTASM